MNITEIVPGVYWQTLVAPAGENEAPKSSLDTVKKHMLKSTLCVAPAGVVISKYSLTMNLMS